MDKFLYTSSGALQYPFADGYTDGTVNGYHYYIRDHQGNNRVVAKSDGTIEQTTHYYPYGGILSQSTNQGVQKYKYNGKEFDTMHGLNMYDYGARQQDPETGLFTSMDPLCEKYYNISPYAYCAGNPIRYVDPDGKQLFLPTGPMIDLLFAGNHNVKTAVFYCIHNDAARAIGTPQVQGTISNTASNFEINIAKGVGLHWTSPGDQGNAIRHTLWQSIITHEYGEDIAMQAGECHEDTKYTSSTKTQFRNIEDADTYIDKKNNEIGRDIGKNNPNADRKTLAKKVMERYYKNGLYVATEQNGIYIPTLQKITKEQYERAIQIIDKKNMYGLNK